MMKKVLALALSMAMMVSALAGCGGKGGGTTAKTPEELTQAYLDAITEHGGEMVEYNPVITEAKEGEFSALMLETLGLKAEDMQAFGISMSMMLVQAYTIAAIYPAEGKADAVKQALQTHIDNQIKAFESYLPGPFEVAKNAKLETLEDGTILLVMCEDQNAVFDAISAQLAKV